MLFLPCFSLIFILRGIKLGSCVLLLRNIINKIYRKQLRHRLCFMLFVSLVSISIIPTMDFLRWDCTQHLHRANRIRNLRKYIFSSRWGGDLMPQTESDYRYKFFSLLWAEWMQEGGCGCPLVVCILCIQWYYDWRRDLENERFASPDRVPMCKMPL